MSAINQPSFQTLKVKLANRPIEKLERTPGQYAKMGEFSVHGGRVYAYVKKSEEALSLESSLVKISIQQYLET